MLGLLGLGGRDFIGGGQLIFGGYWLKEDVDVGTSFADVVGAPLGGGLYSLKHPSGMDPYVFNVEIFLGGGGLLFGLLPIVGCIEEELVDEGTCFVGGVSEDGKGSGEGKSADQVGDEAGFPGGDIYFVVLGGGLHDVIFSFWCCGL